MKEFVVKMFCIDFCGYEQYYKVLAEDENDAEDKVLENYLNEFLDEYGLEQIAPGEYTEYDNLTENGKVIDEQDVTNIMCTVVYDN
tara:strand:- start:41 stop:298 length:258 start_codon:yes stop_codon:yes gene_type:complete